MTENYSNFYATLLSAGIDDNDLALTVDSSVGAPSPNFRLLVQDAEDDQSNRELMLVTAKVGDVFTITRGIETTTAVAHSGGSFVAHVISAGGLLQGIYDRVADIESTIIAVLDGGDADLTTGPKLDLTINFAAQIESWTMFCQPSGSVVVDVWKDSYANYPPVVGDSITASAKPTISSGIKGTGSPTGWNGTINPGDVLRFNVDSASSVVRVTLALNVVRS